MQATANLEFRAIFMTQSHTSLYADATQLSIMKLINFFIKYSPIRFLLSRPIILISHTKDIWHKS